MQSMDKQESIAILKQLADGTDPYTGETLPEQSPYNHPQTVRALAGRPRPWQPHRLIRK